MIGTFWKAMFLTAMPAVLLTVIAKIFGHPGSTFSVACIITAMPASFECVVDAIKGDD